jgi:hypothetical protein
VRRDLVRLTFKQFRFEALAIGASLLTLATVLIVVAIRLQAIDVAACSGPGQPLDCGTRRVDVDGLFSFISVGQVLAAALPVFGALVLGVASVGRELERGTTTLIWPLARSRARWLGIRWLILGAAVLVAVLIVGLAADAMHEASRTTHAGATFDMIDLRGWIVAVRAVAAFTLAVLVGAVFGRSLPGLLVAMIVMAVLVLGVDSAMGAWTRTQAVTIDMSAVNEARMTDTHWRDVTTGRVLSRLEYLAVTPPPDAPADWDAVTFEPIPIGVPGARAGDYLAVEGAILAGITILLLAGSVAVVERRTPY